jgi:plasmid maintenance system antidote protein VapI
MRERLKKAIDYLKFNNNIKNQDDLAEKMEYNRSSVSQAINGDERYLTDTFILNFCRKFKNINEEWIRTGSGEMLQETVNQEQAKPAPQQLELSFATLVEISKQNAEINKQNANSLENIIALLKAEKEEKTELIEIIKNLSSKRPAAKDLVAI